MNLLKVPKPQQEDPKVTALREQEQVRAEEDKIRATQDQLATETRFRSNRKGLRSLIGPLALGGAASRIRSLVGVG